MCALKSIYAADSNFLTMSISRTIIVYFHVFCIYFLIIGVSTTKRRINCTDHSGYDTDTNTSLNLVHVTAVGDHDTVHYLWSSYKVPSAIVARTNSSVHLKINFQKLRSMEDGALIFSEEPLALTGLTISELFEKSYSSDTASIDQINSEVALGLEFFQWYNVTNATFSCSDLSASLYLESSSKDDVQLSENGIFRMQFSVSGIEEEASDFPHLVYTGNSTQLKVAFDDFHTQLNSSRTRYGLEMLLFTKQIENCSDIECKGIVEDSISDEFSPGIFSDVHVKTPCSRKDNEKGSFLSWRPVAYISKEPTVANSSDAYMSQNCPQIFNGTARSIAELFFKDQVGVSANVFNMTFGTVGGGFYAKTLYSEWSFMLGTGTPVTSKLSVAAIVIMSIGVGGIGLSLLGGAIFLIVRSFRRDDDDLLLDEHGVN